MRESGGGLSWPREGRRGKSAMLQWVRMRMYLMDKHSHLIIVLVRLCGTVLVPFSWIYAASQFHSFMSPELGSCVRVQRVRTRSAVNVERPSASATYTEASFISALSVHAILLYLCLDISTHSLDSYAHLDFNYCGSARRGCFDFFFQLLGHRLSNT